MAVIKAGSSQFPFHITDIAALLRLNIRRRGPDFLYVDCPLCGDHRGKLYLKTSRDVWHCNYCQESGGMLALYAKVYGISNADAYREICEALQTGDYAPEYQSYQNRQPQEIAQSVRAPRQAIHQTLSMLFSMLSLTPKHRAHLREVRGLTYDQIERFGFKSTPPPYLCKSLTARLLKQGCTLQGVPGFYMAEDGRWTVRFGTRTAGILIPARSADGLVCGAQIRLDIPIREENAPADKEGTKYLWLSSSSKPMGTSSESPIHFVGDPCSRVVYVTEGLLKADICHALMHRTFAATAGANNVSKLDALFAFLKKNGTEEIIEAQDMDKYRNVHVEKGASKIYLMARKHGLQCRRLTWNPNYKGLDDWQLALRKNAGKAPKTMTFREQYLYGACEIAQIDACVERWHKAQPDGVSLQAYLGLPDEEYHAFLQPGGNARLAELLNAQRKQLGCLIYQLEFTDTEKTKPFAFSGIDALHKAGVQQPPASEYRLVRDETLYDNAESWRLTLLAHQNDFAETMQIPLKHLHWYAAFHDEGEHPHIHMMLWSDDPQYGFLRKDKLLHMQSVLTNMIYADELKEIYIQKDVAYKEVTEAARAVMRELVDRMESVSEPPASVQQKLLELAMELRTVSGKKQYAYLKKSLKDKADEIVDELEKLPEVAAYYSVWNGLRDTLEGYYKNQPRQHNPLSQQKEFRAIKNAIIQEAVRLRQQMEPETSQAEEPSAEETSRDASANPTLANENTSSTTSHSVRLPSEYLLNSTVRLFHQVGQIFRDNAAPPSNPMGIRVDSKRRKKLMQKRLAMGHKQDDHEQNYGQTLQ